MRREGGIAHQAQQVSVHISDGTGECFDYFLLFLALMLATVHKLSCRRMYAFDVFSPQRSLQD